MVIIRRVISRWYRIMKNWSLSSVLFVKRFICAEDSIWRRLIRILWRITLRSSGAVNGTSWKTTDSAERRTPILTVLWEGAAIPIEYSMLTLSIVFELSSHWFTAYDDEWRNNVLDSALQMENFPILCLLCALYGCFGEIGSPALIISSWHSWATFGPTTSSSSADRISKAISSSSSVSILRPKIGIVSVGCTRL